MSGMVSFKRRKIIRDLRNHTLVAANVLKTTSLQSSYECLQLKCWKQDADAMQLKSSYIIQEALAKRALGHSSYRFFHLEMAPIQIN